MMNVSIAICTYNRSASLQSTLASMARVRVPENFACELLVIDNASTDNTAEVVGDCNLPNIAVRYLYEPRRGQSNARNTAIAAAEGSIILFTDDDVRPPCNWIEGMCAPILSGKAHAVAGGVKIAPHLERLWMRPEHRSCLASTEAIDANNPLTMVGANMAFSREVLAKVPGFDPELGPGALGFHDESLFAFQIRKAGYRLVAAFDVVMEHHFDENRLLRSSFLDTARKMGRSSAYWAYHWEHKNFTATHLRIARAWLQLTQTRLQRRSECQNPEGISWREMILVMKYNFHRHFLTERKRPRNYDKFGLCKMIN